MSEKEVEQREKDRKIRESRQGYEGAGEWKYVQLKGEKKRKLTFVAEGEKESEVGAKLKEQIQKGRNKREREKKRKISKDGTVRKRQRLEDS